MNLINSIKVENSAYRMFYREFKYIPRDENGGGIATTKIIFDSFTKDNSSEEKFLYTNMRLFKLRLKTHII